MGNPVVRTNAKFPTSHLRRPFALVWGFCSVMTVQVFLHQVNFRRLERRGYDIIKRLQTSGRARKKKKSGKRIRISPVGVAAMAPPSHDYHGPSRRSTETGDEVNIKETSVRPPKNWVQMMTLERFAPNPDSKLNKTRCWAFLFCFLAEQTGKVCKNRGENRDRSVSW